MPAWEEEARSRRCHWRPTADPNHLQGPSTPALPPNPMVRAQATTLPMEVQKGKIR